MGIPLSGSGYHHADNKRGSHCLPYIGKVDLGSGSVDVEVDVVGREKPFVVEFVVAEVGREEKVLVLRLRGARGDVGRLEDDGRAGARCMLFSVRGVGGGIIEGDWRDWSSYGEAHGLELGMRGDK